MPTPECISTANGIRTIIHEDTTLPYESVSVCVDISGDIDDTNSAHFIEHVFMEDQTQVKGLSISQYVEDTGNNGCAETYPEVIRFYFNAIPDSVSNILPLYLKSLARPSISQEAVDTQREIIAAEMRERIANPETASWERILLNHGFSYTSEDEAAGLGTVTPDSLRAYHQRFFVPDNLLVIAAGPIPAASIRAYVEDSPLGGSTGIGTGFGTREYLRPLAPIVVGHESEKTVYFTQMIDMVPDGAASDVLNDLVHSDADTSLTSQARNHIGVYGASLDNYEFPYTASSKYHLESEGTAKQMNFVHQLGQRFLEQLVEQVPDDETFSKTQLRLRNRAIFASGSWGPSEIVSNYFEQLPEYPHIRTAKAIYADIETVTPQDVQALARRLLIAPRSYSIVGSPSSTRQVAASLL